MDVLALNFKSDYSDKFSVKYNQSAVYLIHN